MKKLEEKYVFQEVPSASPVFLRQRLLEPVHGFLQAQWSKPLQTMLFHKVNPLIKNHGHHTENHNGHQHHVKLEEAGSATERNVDAKRG
ncbi:MAG: hypothetical protein HFI24_10825 [Lachnospiraceae bacterium]|nr:hypothetical protein [Lachnospiraceae bacterium]MCI9624969.1 hypothetical protein [Lachnospiraceae bacterium]